MTVFELFQKASKVVEGEAPSLVDPVEFVRAAVALTELQLCKDAEDFNRQRWKEGCNQQSVLSN